MKAIVISEFGGAEVLKIQEVERPIPTDDEILIQVVSCGINPVDWMVRNGDHSIAIQGLPAILGFEVAGIVEEAGSNVADFRKGDKVFGHTNFPGGGGYAEYVVAKAEQFALKPQNISFNEAGSVALAGLTAWSALFHYGKLQEGQHILIHNAAGGVGSLALQFAKAKGAYVIGTSSSNNHEFLKELGADEVIDYKNQKVEELLNNIDVVFDASPVRDNDTTRLNSIKVLKQDGILVSTNADFAYSDEVTDSMKQKQIKGELVQHREYDWLKEIAQLMEKGVVKVFISKIYPLEQIAEAHRESETRHVRGKLVLEVSMQK